MSTRGQYGLKYDDEVKISYNHCDSYPSGLGVNLKTELNNYSINQLIKAFNRIILVCDDFNKKETIEETKLKLIVKEKLNDDSRSMEWYSILRQFQGKLKPYVKDGFQYMYDGQYDGGIEYKYIVNLDEKTFECYAYSHNSIYDIDDERRMILLSSFDLDELKNIRDDEFVNILEQKEKELC